MQTQAAKVHQRSSYVNFIKLTIKVLYMRKGPPQVVTWANISRCSLSVCLCHGFYEVSHDMKFVCKVWSWIHFQLTPCINLDAKWSSSSWTWNSSCWTWREVHQIENGVKFFKLFVTWNSSRWPSQNYSSLWSSHRILCLSLSNFHIEYLSNKNGYSIKLVMTWTSSSCSWRQVP